MASSERSREKGFMPKCSALQSDKVSGLRMSCGFKVKNKEEHPCQRRMAKNFKCSVSFSPSEPRTWRWIIFMV